MLPKNELPCETIPTREQVVHEVKKIVAESSGVPTDEIHETDTPLSALPWDSLDLVECAMEVEEQFDVSIPDNLLDQAKTVSDIADGVLGLLGQPAAE